ncbi:antitoxin [Kitasatospora aureofaciens]|uniref:antitoxin n=1 Tax=Kitasatospora aureofaciens TaxID=1894 RepID=UPI0033AFED6E
MGLMDNLKGRAEELKEKAGELAGRHSDQIEQIVDRAGGAIDKATKGKYSERIEHGAGRAKDAVEDFAHKPKPGGEQGRAPQPPQAPRP